MFQVFLLKNALRTLESLGVPVCFACVADALNLLYRLYLRIRGPAATQATVCHVSEKEEKRYPAAKIAITVRLSFSILRALRDRWQRLDQFRCIEIHTWFWGLGEQNKRNYCWASKWFLLLYSPKPRNQVWISIHRNWSISINGTLSLNAVFDEVLA